MTLSDRIERLGASINETIETLATDVLKDSGFIPETGLPLPETHFPESISNPCKDEPAAQFSKQIQRYNTNKDECDQIRDQELIDLTETDPDKCIYVAIDDVGVRHQKDSRGEDGSKDGKVVENTVIHIQSMEGQYIITAIGMDKAFRYLIAFLFANHLLEDRHIIFFSDGAQNIRKGIETYFSFCPYVHYLDWYHLEKRITELLSMALKGTKEERHEIRYQLDRKLWAGNFDAAINYISNLDKRHIKNSAKMTEAIEYLNRKKPFACCYALRDVLKYRNSSNPAEKANDLVVANRQKHNGMSWSSAGSNSLAVLTAVIKNKELDTYLHSHTIPFSMSEKNNSLAA